MRKHFIFMTLLLCTAIPAAALEITALFPSTASPGTVVTLTGGPFLAGDTVLVGERRIVATAMTSTRFTFTLPELVPGEYTLAVARPGEISPRNFHLHVVQPPPRIDQISPTTLDSCATASERQVTVSGNNFQPGANLTLDNTAIAIDKLSATEIVFTLPEVKPGPHQVQVVNPNEEHSLPHALFLSSTPELLSIERGEDHVVNYDLILTGKNFRPDTRLSVNGAPVEKSPGKRSPDGTVREMMSYVDCNTMIYTRRPFLRDPQELTLQILNPGGEQSNVYQITTP